MEPPPGITRELFLAWRAPRSGTANPERMTNPVWAWLAADPELYAYSANKLFDGPSSLRAGPCWCNHRFGQSRTELGDGRVLAIAGEHEDYYDPDFYIYNDVIVTEPSGAIEIYGYPRDVFPPTDFHSATLVGDRIIVVGSLGYAGQRGDATQLLALDTRDLSVAQLSATGESPGWIYKHTATLAGNAIAIRGGMREAGDDSTENIDDWSLDLTAMRWTRLTARSWSFWLVAREDDRSSSLWRFGTFTYLDAERRAAEIAELGFEPDLALYAARYTPPIDHVAIPRNPENDDEYNVTRIDVGGVIVRYVETGGAVRVAIEGELPELTERRIVEDARAKLAALEHVPYTARRLR